MKHCTSCGAELQPHWKFCTNCQAPQPAQDGGTAAPQDAEEDAVQVSGGHNAEAEQPTQRLDLPAAYAVEQPAAQQPAAQPAHQQPAHISAATPVAGPAAAAPAFNDGGFNDGGSNDGGPTGPQGPAGPGDPASAGKKPSRRTIILVSVLVLLLGLGLAAFFVVQNVIRGGAGSAESAADKLVESIESKDLIGLATMVPPEEREPMQRLMEHLEDKAEEFGLEEAAGRVSDGGEEEEQELTLDGISITFDGVDPEITEIDESTALIKYTSGEARFQLDPAATTGAIRSGLEASGYEDEEKIDETVKLNETGADGSPLTLVATERDGRWYVSPLYSVAEMISQSEGHSRGSVPETSGGSDSPAGAARAAVEAVPDVVSEGSLEPLAGALSIHEGSLLYLYQDMFDEVMGGVSGEELEISDVRFTEGAKDGDRAVAVVENITVESGYGDTVTLTGECIEGESKSDSICFNESGYSIEPSMQMLGGAKIMSLTTIEENGKWRVSLGHTVADWLINWTDSLTREQALAMLQLANSEDAAGEISVDDSTEVKFNSAGYAVLNLKVDEDMMLEAEEEYEFGDLLVYSADGKEQITDLGYGEEVPAGDYKLVVFAGSEWQEEFNEKGADVAYSADLTLVESKGASYTDMYGPMDYFMGVLTDTSADQPKSHTLPGTKEESEVKFEAFGSNESNTPMTVVVSLDGKEQTVEVSTDKDGALTIPYPNDGKEHDVEVSLRGVNADEAFVLLTYTGELAAK